MSTDFTFSEPATDDTTGAVAAEIRAMMGRRGVRQSHLARRLGENDQWLSVRLRGVTPVNVNELRRIAAALGVKMVDLLPREERNPSIASYATLPVPAGSRRPPSGPPGGSTRPAGRGDSSRPTSDRRTALTGR